jgi:hypothetical protein
VYCPGCVEHTPAREFHAQARGAQAPTITVQKEKRTEAEESWEAGSDGGGVYCPRRWEHVPARGDHAPAHVVLVADRAVVVEGWEASSDSGVAHVGLSQPKESRSGF